MRKQSVLADRKATGNREVKKVPFVELHYGRVQGVISSGSDLDRVYVAFVEASTGNFYCCTNNNRVCGGLSSNGCKHLHLMLDEAILQCSSQTVAAFLGLTPNSESQSAYQLTSQLNMTLCKESPGVVFSRFLNYLRFCELEAAPGATPEMDWFTQ